MNRRAVRFLSSALLMAVMNSCQARNIPAVKLPNPATAKCVQDGWLSEPVLSNGVPTDGVCINPKTGQRCPEWAYFRGECSLTDHDPAHHNSHPETGTR